ncbi:HEAT repeat domain-containing protein [Fulvivirga sediminis]|uniref:HEAT repeat domain-containing protein n=1 Tax=Fulvivirga sediminis TaxID=2803949 RepID=A0A937FEI4_9BACT|nr:HEAT repeat domain-containing protein [Fulvivirga sediminis]MBL3658923.1 HEAT repeat domain-containing protein [Fulvivirga sediminis]
MKITLLTLFIACLSIFTARSQNIDTYFQSVRTGSYPQIPSAFFSGDMTLMNQLTPYYKDSIDDVRGKAYYIAYRSATNTDNQKIKKAAIGALIEGVKDKDSGLSGDNIEFLTEFDKDLFSAKDQQELLSVLSTIKYHKPELIKLIGYVNISEAENTLKSYAASSNRRLQWSGLLALSRMGDEASAQKIISILENLPVNDNLVYELVPDLVYTRNKAAFDYLFTIINSNENNCTSPDPDNEVAILCGYRVMEYLAPHLTAQPLPTEDGELAVDNYEQALQELRAWHANHQSDYGILEEGY